MASLANAHLEAACSHDNGQMAYGPDDLKTTLRAPGTTAKGTAALALEAWASF